MLDFLSQNRLVALGLLLIAIYGIGAYVNSEDEADPVPSIVAQSGPVVEESAGPAGPAPEPRPVPPRPPSPEEFNDGDLSDEALIDDTAGFDPSPEGDTTSEPDAGSQPNASQNTPVSSGSEAGGDVSVIVDNDEIESQFN